MARAQLESGASFVCETHKPAYAAPVTSPASVRDTSRRADFVFHSRRKEKGAADREDRQRLRGYDVVY